MDFWLYKQAQQNGHHIAITDGQESYTYQNLYCEASLLQKTQGLSTISCWAIHR